jgi:hypothetical protein
MKEKWRVAQVIHVWKFRFLRIKGLHILQQKNLELIFSFVIFLPALIKLIVVFLRDKWYLGLWI